MNTEIVQSIWPNKGKYRGLSADEAKAASIRFGYNVRPKSKERTAWRRLGGVFSEPMMLLILATAAVYYFIGEQIEAMIFLLSVVPIGLMQYFQETRADETLAALDRMVVEQCKAWRNKKLVTLEVKDLVPGDLVYLTAGDKTPADGYLLSSVGLMIDESMLTGESVPVVKSALPGLLEKIAAEHILYQGTMVAQGEGEMLVEATGSHTAYGRLGAMLGKISRQKTPLQKKIGHLVRLVALVAVFFAIAAGLFLSIISGWKEGILGGLTLAMSFIPEEFPVVFSVFLVMGVWRMAKNNALAREMAAVETLGSASVICTDKTGTLTEGRMSLEKIYFRGKVFLAEEAASQSGELFEITQNAVLSLERVAVDPIEVELQAFARRAGLEIGEIFDEHELVRDSSFNSRTKTVSHIWRHKKTDFCAQYSVGAPEAIINASTLPLAERAEATRVYEEMAAAGLRVIALGQKKCPCESEIVLNDLEFVGLLAMRDPVREGVREAIALCQQAGIRVMMITGDNKLTAHSVAETLGLNHEHQIISGEELDKMSPEAMREAVRRHNIFARVRPEHKLAIVEALQKNGESVAMTGDGVNDAPALKKADVGVVMGKRGTEVARAAADVILLDDNFSTIVRAVREGRRIYRNLQQAFAFLFSFHLPIVGLAFFPLFFGQSLIFVPIQIIFLELFCDPASVLGFERERAPRDLMKEPPRPAKEPLINPKLWKQILIRGLAILGVALGFYVWFGMRLGDFALGRTAAFAALVISQIAAVFLSREWQQVRRNGVLTLISFLTLVALALIMFLPFLRGLFNLAPISLATFGWLFAYSFVIVGSISFLTRKIFSKTA